MRRRLWWRWRLKLQLAWVLAKERIAHACDAVGFGMGSRLGLGLSLGLR